MQLGDTFILLRPDIDNHLQLIISDPMKNDSTVVFAAASTWDKGKDSSCILDQADHPFLRHKSCVYYRDAKSCSLQELRHLERRQLLERRGPLRHEVLNRVLQGAAKSPFLKFRYGELLIEQELI